MLSDNLIAFTQLLSNRIEYIDVSEMFESGVMKQLELAARLQSYCNNSLPTVRHGLDGNVFVSTYLKCSLQYNWIQDNRMLWKVNNIKGNFLLESSKTKKSFAVQSVGGRPKFLKEEVYKKNFLRVIYSAGSAGTSQPVEVLRAILIRKSDQKYLGDFPYAYKPAKGASYKPSTPQWKPSIPK